MKKLPIGIATLSEMRKNNYIYIDKTHHIANLMNGKYYFLSRPRRFGKSLLINTLKEAFSANKELFTGLYLENNWNWSVSYPIIHFDFGDSSARIPEQRLLNNIHNTLDSLADQYAIELTQTEFGAKFQELIIKLYNKTEQATVILIDEYDKPILDCITNLDLAKQMREILKDLYIYIKLNDKYLKFVFITGVSKFSKVSLFSGLNNLNDISLDGKYADICGYTQSELEQNFADYLTAGNVDRNELKKWYNGYNFAGLETQKVYNPFDILLFFAKNYQYTNYWFETATPTFLIELIKQRQYHIPDLELVTVGSDTLSTFEIENISLVTLLFQTGYLTIKQIAKRANQIVYRLTYPNYEVKYSLNNSIALIGSSLENKDKLINSLYEVCENNQFEQLQEILSSHFASIPHDWYRNNKIANYEGFYASVVYSYFTALGYDLVAEDATNHGRIDLSITMPDKILLIEFKLSSNGDAISALAQIKAKNYAQKFIHEHKPIYAIGMSFDSTNRNVVDLVSEQLA
jgi:hypothetical protein